MPAALPSPSVSTIFDARYLKLNAIAILIIITIVCCLELLYIHILLPRKIQSTVYSKVNSVVQTSASSILGKNIDVLTMSFDVYVKYIKSWLQSALNVSISLESKLRGYGLYKITTFEIMLLGVLVLFTHAILRSL